MACRWGKSVHPSPDLGTVRCRPTRWGLLSVAQSASRGLPLSGVVAQPLHGDDDVISHGEFDVGGGLTETVREVVVRLADLASTVADRVLVEQAVGMLMVAYDLDADNAVELLTWGARALDITVGLLALQLTEDFGGRAHDREGPTGSERMDLRSACDDVLFTAHERVSSVSRRRRGTEDQRSHPRHQRRPH